MLIFKKKKVVASEPIPIVTQEYTVPHSESFKGFKQIKLATYMYEPAYKGIRALGSAKIKTVTFSFVKIGVHKPLHVLANGHLVGTIWSYSWEKYYKDIKAEKINCAHIEILDRDEVFLFVQYK